MIIDYIIMKFPASSETFASNDIKEIASENNDVFVHSLKNNSTEIDELKIERNIGNISTSYFSIKSLLFVVYHPIIFINTFFWIFFSTYQKPIEFIKSVLLLPRSIEIFSDIKKRKPDIVHLFWGHYPAIVGYLVDKYSCNTQLSIFLGAYDLAKELSYSFKVAERSQIIWTHSFFNKRKLVNQYNLNKNKIKVAYRGVNLNKIKFIENEKKDFNYFISAGRLIKSKNMISVIKVYERLNNKKIINLDIFGKGDRKKALQKYIEDKNISQNVKLCGHVPQKQLMENMSKANIFILMTNKESEMLPNVIKEAMASKCICVVSPSPGIEELIKDKETGFIIKDNNLNNAINIINDILSEKYDLNSIRNNAYNKIKKEFDISKEIDKYLKEWDKLV